MPSLPLVRRTLAPLALVAGAGASARAQEDPRQVQPERPTVSTHAQTVAPGFAELESGLERDRYGDRSQATTVGATLKLGLGRTTQLNLTVPVPGGAATTFDADLSVGLKWRVLEHHPLLGSVAVLPALMLPTGGANGAGGAGGALLLVDSHTRGETSFDVNVGLAWHRAGDRAPAREAMWAAAWGFPLRGRLGWTAELSGQPGVGGPAGASPSVALLTGPVVRLGKRWVADAGVISRVAGDQPQAVYAGLVTSLGRFTPSARPPR